MAKIVRITPREMEVFEALGRGETSKEIARRLRLSVKTVEAHREKLKRKLRLTHAFALLRAAVRHVEGVAVVPAETVEIGGKRIPVEALV